MAKPRLTRKQRVLVAEVKELLSTLRLNADEIVANADSNARTTYLELAKDQLIRGEVVRKYVLMDEFLSATICWHYFGKKRGFPQLWRTQRFRTFNYFILERLYLLHKLDLVKGIHEIPRWVSSDLALLNDLRNGVTHSYFPENRRRKPDWKGESVFTPAGFARFAEDMERLSGFFSRRFWAGSPEDTEGSTPTAPNHGGGRGGRVARHEPDQITESWNRALDAAGQEDEEEARFVAEAARRTAERNPW